MHSYWPILQDRSVRAGDAVLFPCRTDSVPAPSVRWYKDGSLVSANDANRRLIPYSGSLEILRATGDDAGVYKCRVSSADKYRESEEGRLEVADSQLLQEPYAPRFEAKPESQVVVEGADVVLECGANGYPEAQVGI